MKKKQVSFSRAIMSRFLFIIGVFGIGCFTFSNAGVKVNSVRNVNLVKSIEAINIINKYDNRNKTLKVMEVNNMREVALYGPDTPVSFMGQMTAYYPICEGCTGYVYCPPRQKVTDGNVYFNDVDYGKIRILAADYSIPCGSIVQISNVSFSNDPIIGIVLDRGGAIKGNIMDFLVSEDDDANVVGRQRNVKFEILRWGW